MDLTRGEVVIGVADDRPGVRERLRRQRGSPLVTSGMHLITSAGVTSVLGLATFVVADALDIGEAAGPQWWFGLALGAGGAAGAVVGARLQPRLPVALLRIVLAVAALSAGVRLLMT